MYCMCIASWNIYVGSNHKCIYLYTYIYKHTFNPFTQPLTYTHIYIYIGILLVRIQQRYETISQDSIKMLTLSTINTNNNGNNNNNGSNNGIIHCDYGTMGAMDQSKSNPNALNSVNSLHTENICVRSAVLVGSTITSTIKQTISSSNDKKNEDNTNSNNPNNPNTNNSNTSSNNSDNTNSNTSDIESGLSNNSTNSNVYCRKGTNSNNSSSNKDKIYMTNPTSIQDMGMGSQSDIHTSQNEVEVENLISNVYTSHFKKNRIIGRKILSINNIHDNNILYDSYNFSIYALAMYSQLIMLYMYPVSGPCRVCGCCNPLVCSCIKDTHTTSNTHPNTHTNTHTPHIIGDNKCRTHQLAIEEILRVHHKLHHTDIYYLSMLNTNIAKPYAIFLDHETQCVVVSIRYVYVCWLCICIYVLGVVCISRYIYTTHTYTIYTRIHTLYIHTYIYTHTHLHTHTYIYTYL